MKKLALFAMLLGSSFLYGCGDTAKTKSGTENKKETTTTTETPAGDKKETTTEENKTEKKTTETPAPDAAK